jgi:ribulose-phosphate 3-epimerase
MISDVDRWAPGYAELGAFSVTFHAEATGEPVALARRLREIGSRAGIAVKPGTSLDPYLELLPEFDQILVMTVEPGFGGQSFMADMMPKVAAARAAIDAAGIDVWLQVDGGIALDTIGQAAEAGADTFVAGSAVYGAADVEAAIAEMRAAAEAHAHRH